MKKYIGIFLIIMMLIVTSISIGDDTYTSEAVIEDYYPTVIYLDSYIAILNETNVDIWNQTNYPNDNDRSDSYIWGGETLFVNVTVRDDNGASELEGHNVEVFLLPELEPIGSLSFVDFKNIEKTIAYFTGTFSSEFASLQCKHNVSVRISSDFGPFWIYDPLYINPEMSATFSEANINWSHLHVGDMDVEAFNNPYEYNITARCWIVYQEAWYDVSVDTEVSINATDMALLGNPSIVIPLNHIRYSVDGSPDHTPYTPFSLTPVKIGEFVANTPIEFNFTIDVPFIDPGIYRGDINYFVNTI